MVQTLKELIANWNEIEKAIFVKVPITSIIIFGDHVESIYRNDVKRIRRYPHGQITPEEKILFIELKDLMDEFSISYLRTFFLNDAKAHNIDIDFMDSPSEFENKTGHSGHVKSIIKGDLRHLRQILENLMKILVIISRLESEWGLLSESSSVKCYFD